MAGADRSASVHWRLFDPWRAHIDGARSVEVETNVKTEADVVRYRTRGPGVMPTRVALFFWSVVFFGVGAAFFFLWGPLVKHVDAWPMSGDVWGIWRAAHYIGWGDIGGIYGGTTGVISLPGLPVIFAPFAMLAGAMHLTESFGPYNLPRPTAGLLLEPLEFVVGGTVLVAASAVIRQVTPTVARRALKARPGWRPFAMLGAVAVVAWPVVAIWGHAEDVAATACLLGCVVLLDQGHWKGAAWLLGAGICLQPLVVAAVPVLLGATAAGRRLRSFVRYALPGGALGALALASNWSGTYESLVKQPETPAFNHATPWLAVVPHLYGNLATHVLRASFPRQVAGHFAVTTRVLARIPSLAVSGGDIRSIGLLGAVALGVYAWRRRPDLLGVVWLVATALALRCYFEPVMTPYYLAPPLIVALLAAGCAGWRRFGLAVVFAFGVTVFAYYRFSPWAWFLPVVALLTVVLACGYPGRAHLAPGRGATDEDGGTSPERGGGGTDRSTADDRGPGGRTVGTTNEETGADAGREAGAPEREREPVLAMGRTALATRMSDTEPADARLPTPDGPRGMTEGAALDGGALEELAGVGSLSEAWRRAALAVPAETTSLRARLAHHAVDALRWALGARGSQRPDRVLAAGELLA